MYHLWLHVCVFHTRHPFKSAFVLGVVVMHLTYAFCGATWPSLLLGLAVAFISGFFLTRLVRDTLITLIQKHERVSAAEAAHIYATRYRKPKP